MCEAEKWLKTDQEGIDEDFRLEILEATYRYIKRNDEYTFEEAFESVDSVVYGMWWNSK